MKLRRLQTRDVTFSLHVEQDDTAVRGNALASGDDDADREAEDEILERLAPEAGTTTFVLGLYLDTEDGSNDQIDWTEGTRAECEAWLDAMLARTFSVNGEAPIDLATLAAANRHDFNAVYYPSMLHVGETWGPGAGGDVRRIA